MAEQCEICGQALTGELGVTAVELPFGTVVVVGAVSPRNWILCDGCNALLCHACCQDPASGYCDACLCRQASKNEAACT